MMKNKLLKGILVIILCTFAFIKNVNASTYQEYIDMVAPDGKMIINSIAPTSIHEAYSYITYYLHNVSVDDSQKYGYTRIGKNDNDNINYDGKYSITFCEYKISDGYRRCENNKEVVVNVKFDNSKIDKTIEKEVNGYIKNFPKGNNYQNNNLSEIVIQIDDMELVSYLSKTNSNYNILFNPNNIIDLLNYNSKYKEITNNVNLVKPWNAKGNGIDIAASINSNLLFEYNNFIYGTAETSIREFVLNAIYVDNTVKEDNDSIVEAVQTRLDKNLGKNVAKISLADNTYLDEMIYEIKNDYLEHYDDIILDETKIINQLFNINIGGYDYKFIVIKDSTKIKDLSLVKTVDFKSLSTIEFDSKYSPADSTISIVKNDDNQKILDKLNLKDGITYDIKLFSKSSNNYINKINKGKFIVTVPLEKFTDGQNLYAYYINEDGTVEKHKVTIKENFAVFETDHFSTYTIALSNETINKSEEENITNPETYDQIITWFAICLISIIGIVGIMFTKKHI